MTTDFDRNTIALRIEDVSNLLSLAIDLVAELNCVDSNGKRIRTVDQLGALLRSTLTQITGMPDQVEALP